MIDQIRNCKCPDCGTLLIVGWDSNLTVFGCCPKCEYSVLVEVLTRALVAARDGTTAA